MITMKKAQAAMEFLMTYGWAILVVLAAIGALAYFGVLSPDKFLPEKCTLPSGIACIDYRLASSSSLEVVIQNAQGNDMYDVTAGIETATENCSSAMTDLLDGQKSVFVIDCADDIQKGKFKTPLTVRYTRADSAMNHTKVGEIIMNIE